MKQNYAYLGCRRKYVQEYRSRRQGSSGLARSFAFKRRANGAAPFKCSVLSRAAEESEVEGSKHQDNADIHDQPFPKSISEEREVYTDDKGRHRHNVKHDHCVSAHFGTLQLSKWALPGLEVDTAWRASGGIAPDALKQTSASL